MAKQLRICAQCGHPIAEQRPVFLVGTPSGHIVGPFHAGCAEHISLGMRRGRAAIGLGMGETYGTWPSIREETLPE